MEKNGEKKKEAKYKHPSGEPIEYHSDRLVDYLNQLTSTLVEFFDLLVESQNDSVSAAARTGMAIVCDERRQIDDLIENIERYLGKVHIDYKANRVSLSWPNKILGVTITPKAEAGGK